MSYDQPESLDAAFRDTFVLIEVDGRTIVIDPAAASWDFPWDDPVYVITAWNPCVELSAEENHRRNLELEELLLERGLRIHRADGRARDGSWREASFAVVGIGRDIAVDIGRRFGQRAIFEATSSELTVLPCDISAG